MLMLFYILGLVGKKWLILRVSPLWNFNFNKNHLNLLSKQLQIFLMKHNKNSKSQKNSFLQISVEMEAKEAHHEYIALMVNKLYNCNIKLQFNFSYK